jgi:hypothetical protein
MRRVRAALVCSLFGLVPCGALAQQPVRRDPPAAPAPCDGVRCSRHGECVSEDTQAYCFCDEGYRAEELRCVASRPRPARAVSSVEGTRIVEVALAEEGHRLEQVGAMRFEAPGPLSHWVSGILWCSDFVSWVYRVAGAPFTGGYGDGGGWQLTSNTTIRAWYQRHHAWVDHDSPEWSTFRPRAGDYLRISTPTWGHSAIVRYVEGSTLYTIEGNASGRVVTTHYRDFRSHSRIDGFGMTTMADARIAATRAHEGTDVTR